MKNKKYILGIDTSNYKTSIAVIDSDKNIVCDCRRLLMVKQGERGLRQSDALFQHIKNLPELIEEVCDKFDGKFCAVAYSSKPRPVEGSYMPVFLAGESFARSLAAAMGIDCIPFSHQEGHIEAIKAYSNLKYTDKFLACHFSGGTCEFLKVSDNSRGYDIEIIGGSKDISFGQVIDRAGVAMGLAFPAGEELDTLAIDAESSSRNLTPIKVKDMWLNLSGIDTQIKKHLDAKPNVDKTFVREIFEKLSDSVCRMLIQGVKSTGINDIIMAGGVSSSRFMRQVISKELAKEKINVIFDNGDLSQDNAVGTALLGGNILWD